MLRYAEFCMSPYEVPKERSICICISGCVNRCKNCHYQELQKTNYGEPLCKYFNKIIELYHQQATCVCFLGEGSGTPDEKRELNSYVDYAHRMNLKACLYSGRDTNIESWMYVFDYIKLGSFQEALGSLDSKTTNQRFFMKNGSDSYVDITAAFCAD